MLAGLRRLVDTLIEGYVTLNRRPWVLAIPIGLDLFLWLGPRILPTSLAEAMASFWQSVAQQAPSSLPIEPEAAAEVASALQNWGIETNLTRLLSSYLIPLLLPHLSNPALPGYSPPSWSLALGWVLLPLPLAMIALSLLSWALYQVPMADLVRGSDEGGVKMLRRVPLTWWRTAILAGMALLAGAGLFLAAGLLSSVVMLISQSLAVLIVYLGLGVVLWILFHLYFAPNAILLSGVGPRRAIYYSTQVVRSSPWSSLGFVLLVSMVRIGTASLWQRLAVHPLGVLGGILGNAYIVSGLATAGLVFYRDRLQEWLSRIKAAQSGPANPT